MSDEISKFVEFAAKKLDLSKEKCTDLFCSYLYYESLIGLKKIKDTVVEEKGKSFLYEDYMEKPLIDHLSSMSSILNILMLFKSLLGDDKWRKNEAESHRFEKYTNQLKEELLKLIIWSLHLLDFSTDQLLDIVELFPVFCNSKFGTVEPMNQNSLLAMVYLKIFNIDVGLLEYFVNENEPKCENTWLWTSASVGDIAKISKALDDIKPENLPFYGVFCLLRCLTKDLRVICANKDVANDSTTLGLTAKRHNAFSQCLAVIQADVILKDESLYSMTATGLLSVLNAFMTFYDVNLSGEKENFDELACYLLKNHYVAEEFWSQSSSAHDNHVLMFLKENKLFKFPFDLENSLSIAASICESSSENCHKFVGYLQNITCFCEKMPSSSVKSFLEVINDSTVRLLVDITYEQYGIILLHLFFATALGTTIIDLGGFTLPIGSVGKVIEANRVMKSPVPDIMPPVSGTCLFLSKCPTMNILGDYVTINWRVFFNGWQILLAKLQTTHDLGDSILVFDLVGTILRLGNAKNTRLLSHFLQEALSTLKNIHSNEVDGNFLFIESSLRCLSYCSEEFAYEVFNDLRCSLFGDSCCAMSGSLRGCGLYKSTFYSYESVVGKYNFTLSLLRLLEKCIPKALTVDDAEFCSILSFIMDSIFVNYPQWFYVNAKDKNEIGLMCLKIAHKCTTVLAVDCKLPGKVPLLTTTCCRSFLYGEARNRLLNIIVDFARKYNGFVDVSIAMELSSQVSLAVSILTHLLGMSLFYMSNNSKSENSLQLPPLLSDIYCKENQLNDLLFTSLGSLFNVRFSDQLPILSLICLQKFAEVFPSSLLYGFGSYIDDFCDIFFKRLQSPSEKTELRAFCVDFLTNCLQYQVGFLEKLQSKTNAGDLFNAMKIITGLIKCENDMQPNLLLSCLRFISSLWKFNYEFWIKELLTDADFWPAVMTPLTCGESNCFLAICKEIFDILTFELHKMLREKSKCIKDFYEIVSENWKNCDRLKLFFKKFEDLFQSSLETEEKYENLKSWTNFLAMALSYDDKTNKKTFDELCSFTILELVIAAQINLIGSVSYKEYVKLGHALNDTILTFAFYCHKEFDHSKFWPKVFHLHTNFVAHLADIDITNDGSDFFRLPLSVMLIILSSDDRKLKLEVVLSLLESVAKMSRKIFKSDTRFSNWVIADMHKILSIIIDIISSCLKQALFHSWQPILKRYNVLLNAVEFFKHCCFSGQLSLDVGMSICNLFHSAILNADDLDFVKSSNFNEFVYSHLPSYIFDQLEDKQCRMMFNILLDFHSTLVNKDARLCENATTFLRSWEEYFAKIAFDSLYTTSVENLECLRHMCDFFYSLAKSGACPLLQDFKVIDLIKDYSSTFISRIVCSIANANTLNRKVMPSKSAAANENEELSVRTAVAQKSCEILLISLQTLICFNPPVSSVITQDSLDYEACKCVCQPCFSTNIIFSEDDRLTFGHLLVCVQLCITSLRKTDLRSSSPSIGRSCVTNPSSFMQSDRCLTFTLLESVVYFYLVEGFITINKLENAQINADLFKRELSSELVLLLSKCCRSSSPSLRAKSPGSSSAGSHSPAVTAAFHGFNMEFLFNARDLADSLSRS